MPDGKPNLTAPAPRKDGKPALSGVWTGDKEAFKYLNSIATDFRPGEFPIRPWAEALTKVRMTGAHASEFPPTHCLPQGITILDGSMAVGCPLKIVQDSNVVVLLYEAHSQFRQILMDGRPIPKDPNPTWLGYSVGRWDGDTLVVETAGFNGMSWLDLVGHPSTDALRITERFHRRDFGHLDIQLMVDDPKAYTKPWTVSLPALLFADTELLESVCNENEKDLKHMVDK